MDVKWLGRAQGSWTEKRSFAETQDTGVLLHVLQDVWERVPKLKPLRVGVALAGLAAEQAHQPDLFDKPRDAKLVRAIDAVNESSARARSPTVVPLPVTPARSPSKGCPR